MKLEHIAIWTYDLEKVKKFYVKYFGVKCSEKYINVQKKFSSYFLSFEGEDTRIELMHNPDIKASLSNHAPWLGLSHFAISVGNRKSVNELTELLRSDGYNVVSEPRITGDGYYESVIEDCECNKIEITE
ncbi:glyoxalase/bleomycin resistance/extradiol dioxygenase family protein [Sinomicrobium pectinilyticum]|uniref:Glyoxalase/bleomycin resistance/extradiol dioxygenase family protein n=1 Tax=Sinomicrobium pectinilyticum TaxID=1084421 RepID=A0A3N0EEJ8_SINP1|nr:VOC family protein [Sinomicrobium pectinilyticum]RNL86276.1 glyoxalase/bleomycin resistance/extradiol dioxygenase family protein [Sinomicrobium pectinilyticum]